MAAYDHLGIGIGIGMVSWQVVRLAALVAFAILGAIVVNPFRPTTSPQRVNDAHVLMQVLER